MIDGEAEKQYTVEYKTMRNYSYLLSAPEGSAGKKREGGERYELFFWQTRHEDA